MKILSKLLTILLITFSLNSQAQTIVDIVVGSPDHNTLEAAVIAADLAGTLSGPGPFTVFAPTDAAFAALGQATIDALLADPQGALTAVLLQHAVSGVADGSNISDGLKIGSLAGDNLEFTTSNGLQVNGITISTADIKATNGVVHVIDAVINKPQTVVDVVVNSPDHNTLEAAVLAAGLAGTLSGPGPFTVFAPTDAAFAALGQATIDALLSDPQGDLTTILLYHAVSGVAGPTNLTNGSSIGTVNGQNLDFTVSGNGIMVNNANITVANIETNNGVVHVIDAVLIPEIKPATVVDVIVNSADHNTLETAVLAAGLETALSGPGPFTIFAPTDAAFAALDPALLNAALADPQGLLTTVLTYHAVSGVADSGGLFDGQRMGTLAGQNITFSVNANGVMVNNANITVVDIVTENGIVHVIDAVLLPNVTPAPVVAESVVDIIVNSPDHNTLETAVLAAGLETALSGPGPFTVFAPTDAAFAAVDPDVLNSLLADPSGALTQVLSYHVVSGEASTSNIFDGMVLPSLQGSPLNISINANGAFINDAQIIVTDIQSKNGVVHVIDAVLVP